MGALVALASCNNGKADPPDATGSSTGGVDDNGLDSGPPMLADDHPVVCEPGEVRCNGGDNLERCDGTGLEWVLEPCAENTQCTVCNPDSGVTCVEDQCLGPCEAASMVPSSAGCLFIANRQIHQQETFPDGLIVANPDEENTATVNVFQIAQGDDEEVLLETVTLEPNDDYVVDMTNEFVAGNQSLLRSGGMYRITSDFPIIASQHAPRENNSGNESSLLLPDSVLGQTYVVVSYSPHYEQHQGKGYPSYFEVIALEKDTEVEWTPPVPTYGTGPIDDVAAGETGKQANLNRYDTLRITADEDPMVPEDDRDLSGTVITSNKPIWVVGGSRCSRIPVREFPARGFCDPLQEVLIPVKHWGTDYIAAAPPKRENENHYWRVYAGGKDTTTFTTDPQVLTEENCTAPATFADGACTLPQRGAWIEIEVPNATSFIVEGQTDEDRLMVVGYLQSRRATANCSPEQFAMYPEICDAGGELWETATEIGDSAMYQLVPTAQFLQRYVFRTAEGFDSDYVQVVRAVGGQSVFLDGNGLQGWRQINFDYEFVNVLLDEPGTHTIESASTFGIVQIGYSDPSQGSAEGCAAVSGQCSSSYAYPGGMKSEQIFIP